MKRHLILFFSFALCFAWTNGQNNAVTPANYSIIPPSPEVASLMKYVDYPVSQFTGQPEINLPIYTLTEGSLSIPISVSYHGGGIKVDELPGIIGTGWTLMAGGAISRSASGIPDEIETSYIQGLFNIDDLSKTMRARLLNRMEGSDYDPADPPEASAFTHAQCVRFNEGRADMTNDIFQMNFMGKSGTFTYNPYSRGAHSKGVILSTASDIKIYNTGATLGIPESYEIVDKSYNKYIFETTENTKYNYNYKIGGASHSDSLYYTSAWHLSKIFSNVGDTVEFEYFKGNRILKDMGSNAYFAFCTDTDYQTHISDKSACIINYFPKHLRCIKSRNTLVEFSYSNNFECLSKITIYTNNAEKKKIKEFIFTHSSFNLADYTRRLLYQIKEVTANETIVLYEMEYANGDNRIINNVKYAQDHWGYYNGEENQTLLTAGQELSPFCDANRDATFYAYCGMLNSVKYATGGKTNFNWESNDYSYIGDVSVKRDSIRYKTETYTHKLKGTTNVQITRENQVPTKEYIFSAEEGSALIIDISTYIKLLMDSGTGMIEWQDYYRDLDAAYQSTNPRVELLKMEINGGETRLGRWAIDSRNSSSKKTFTLRKGNYKVKLINPTNFSGVSLNTINGYFGTGAEKNDEVFGYIGIERKKEVEIKWTIDSEPWGGYRIASISSSPNSDSPDVTKYYDYYDEDTQLSSGIIVERPSYESKSYIAKRHLQVPGIKVVGLDECYSNGLYSTPNGASHVEYPSVWESYSASSLRIKHIFDSQRENPDEMNASFYEYVPGGLRMNTSLSHRRGNLIEKKYFLGNDNYKNERYNYRILENNNVPLFNGQLKRIYDATEITLTKDIESDFALCRYKLLPYNKNIESIYTTETVDNKIFEDSVCYSYFNNSYNRELEYSLVRSKSFIDSKGKWNTTYYTYKKQTVAGRDTYLDLVETETTFCDGKFIVGKKMEYDYRNRLVATFRSAIGASITTSMVGTSFGASYQLAGAINIPEYKYKYNSIGNIIEIRYNDVPLVAYIWAYNGASPIAEIKNKSYDEVVATLPQSLKPESILSRYDVTVSDLAQIRSSFPANDVTTITSYPLIGVSSLTNSRGITTYFGYDEFGRLKDVKDYNNYFIRKYKYHYK